MNWARVSERIGGSIAILVIWYFFLGAPGWQELGQYLGILALIGIIQFLSRRSVSDLFARTTTAEKRLDHLEKQMEQLSRALTAAR